MISVSIPWNRRDRGRIELSWLLRHDGAPFDYLSTASWFRLLVPAIYGMKNLKWSTRIEAVN